MTEFLKSARESVMAVIRETLLKSVFYLLFLLGLAVDACGQQETVHPPIVEPNVISWGTASEHGSFGYDVFRGTSEDGPFSPVNPEVIPAAGTTDIPQRYEFIDDSIEPDTEYWYYIESISLTGERKRITPVYASKPRPATQAAE